MYRLTADPDVIHYVPDNTFIPRGHRLWDDYEAWLAGGNTPAPEKPLAIYQQEKIVALREAAERAVAGGFASHALGSPHFYSSARPQDVSNIIGAKLAEVDIHYTCVDANGVLDQRLHTPAQMNQVFQDGVAWVQHNQNRFHDKRRAVEAAETHAAVDAVTWEDD